MYARCGRETASHDYRMWVPGSKEIIYVSVFVLFGSPRCFAACWVGFVVPAAHLG